jgi:hypothetical protein
MNGLDVVLAWILEIAGAGIILFAAVVWVVNALKGRFATSTFMALVASFVFYISVLLGFGNLRSPYIFWFTVVYGAIAVFYIVTHMIETARGTSSREAASS